MKAGKAAARLLAGILVLAAGGTAGGKPAGAPVSKEAVRQAILIFRRDPTSTQGAMARTLILGFAKDSPDVEVVVAPKLVPWLKDKALSQADGAALTAAYCAGDIAAQLDGGKAHDVALVGGCEQVIATYRQLQAKRPAWKLTEVEKLIVLQQNHQLRRYLRDAGRDTGTGPTGSGR